jgi:hypothetical protein
MPFKSSEIQLQLRTGEGGPFLGIEASGQYALSWGVETSCPSVGAGRYGAVILWPFGRGPVTYVQAPRC